MTKFNPRQIQSETKFSSRQIQSETKFSPKFFFFQTSGKNSQTEFFLGLHLSWISSALLWAVLDLSMLIITKRYIHTATSFYILFLSLSVVKMIIMINEPLFPFISKKIRITSVITGIFVIYVLSSGFQDTVELHWNN